jgi:hypothetical protein
VCDLAEVDGLLTDADAVPGMVSALEVAGITVVVAKARRGGRRRT